MTFDVEESEEKEATEGARANNKKAKRTLTEGENRRQRVVSSAEKKEEERNRFSPLRLNNHTQYKMKKKPRKKREGSKKYTRRNGRGERKKKTMGFDNTETKRGSTEANVRK